MLALVLIMGLLVLLPKEVGADSVCYSEYTDIAKIFDYNSCPSIQGLAVGSQKLYTVKINGSDSQAFISMTDKDTGETVRLYNSDAGSYMFDDLGHANDMDVWGIDGASNIFVATAVNKGANAIVRLKRTGNTLSKVATYHLRCSGQDIYATAMGIMGVSNGQIHLITKWGMNLYTGSVSVNDTNAVVEMTQLCTINKSRVLIQGKYVTLYDYVNQGMGYHDGTLYVPISGNDDNLDHSVILVYDLNNITTGSLVYPTEALVFQVRSEEYPALFELESCDISSGDGKLYFGVQRRRRSDNTDHDGVACFNDYVYSRLPVDAPTSRPSDLSGYTVHYDANGGEGTMEDTWVDYGVKTPLRTNRFTRNGWEFSCWYAYRTTEEKWYYTNGSSSGWYKEGSQPSGYKKYAYTDGVTVAATSSINGDVVVMYAQWKTDANTYTVRYNANGGSGSMEDTVIAYGTLTPLRPNAFTKSGCKFAGWTIYRSEQNQWYYTNGTKSSWYKEGSQPSGYTKKVYSDQTSLSKSTGVANDLVIVYAQWDPGTFTLRYDANGGTGTMADTVVTYGVNTKIRANSFTRTGCTFLGWYAYRTMQELWYYTDGSNTGWYHEGYEPAGYTKVLYKNQASVAKTSSLNEDVVMMYAQWEGEDYTVMFKNADGTVLQSSVLMAGGMPIAPADPVKAYDSSNHYTFSGWDRPLAVVTKDVTYTAVYTATAHSYTGNVTKVPTCTTPGNVTYTCHCGYSYSAQVDVKEHNYSAVVSAPTCSSIGYTTYTCSVCADSYQSDETAATGHTVGEWVTVQEPTPSVDGLLGRYCTTCEELLESQLVDRCASGISGPDIIWHLNLNTGLLTISGNGSMSTSYIPWKEYCGAIMSVEVKEGVEDLCYGAFQSCSGLSQVQLPTTLKAIPSCAFDGCTSLTRIVLPDAVTLIDSYAFFECSALQEINLPANLTSLGRCSLYGCASLKEIVVPAGVTELPVNAFTNCTGLVSMVLPENMTVIHARAFFNCNALTELVLPAELTEIGEMAFYKCYGLKELTVPAQVSLIGSQAFSGDTFETLMFLGDAPTFAADAFTKFNATVRYPKGNATWDGVAGQNYSGTVTWDAWGEIPVVQPTLTLKAPALEFKDMITVNAFYTAENIKDVVEMGMITYTRNVDVVDIHTADYVIPGATYDESSGRYFSGSQGIHAKFIGDTVYLACYAKLTDGSYVYTKLAGYSPITYATNQLKNSTDMKLKQLVAAMLNYGAAAQNYFLYNMDVLANSTLTEEQKLLPEVYNSDMAAAVPAADAAKQGIFGNNKGFSLRKPAVSFEGAFSINYFFTPAYAPADGITLYYWTEADFAAAEVLTTENASGSMKLEGEGTSQYRGDITGIAAKDLAKAVYVAAIYSDGTTTWTSGVLGYSIGAYCSSMAKGTDAVADLAKATAVYGYHAKAYFGE